MLNRYLLSAVITVLGSTAAFWAFSFMAHDRLGPSGDDGSLILGAESNNEGGLTMSRIEQSPSTRKLVFESLDKTAITRINWGPEIIEPSHSGYDLWWWSLDGVYKLERSAFLEIIGRIDVRRAESSAFLTQCTFSEAGTPIVLTPVVNPDSIDEPCQARSVVVEYSVGIDGRALISLVRSIEPIEPSLELEIERAFKSWKFMPDAELKSTKGLSYELETKPAAICEGRTSVI